jgi:hypothetical protein
MACIADAGVEAPSRAVPQHSLYGSRRPVCGQPLISFPSAVVEGEWNVLLNPKHLQFAKVQIADSKPFRYDERMFR